MKSTFRIVVSVIFFLMIVVKGESQGVGINENGASPHSTSILDIQSSDKGLLVPRLTEAERDAIIDPTPFLTIINTTSGCFNIYSVGGWKQLCPECIQGPPTAGSNSPVCEGESLQLTASSVSGGVYSWTGPNGFTSSDQNPVIPTAELADAGNYYVTVTANGCTSVATATSVQMNTVPSAPTAGSNSPICSGSTLNLTASFVSGGTYSWTGPNGFISGLQNPSVNNASLSDAGT
jgi:hypothetical protein